MKFRNPFGRLSENPEFFVGRNLEVNRIEDIADPNEKVVYLNGEAPFNFIRLTTEEAGHLKIGDKLNITVLSSSMTPIWVRKITGNTIRDLRTKYGWKPPEDE